MRKHIVTFKAFDVVVVPFPFTDRTTTKRRPALVLSDDNNFNNKIGHSVLAMITSAKNSSWPLDITITDLDCAGLNLENAVDIVKK
jgi:mRNA interferase MazF